MVRSFVDASCSASSSLVVSVVTSLLMTPKNAWNTNYKVTFTRSDKPMNRPDSRLNQIWKSLFSWYRPARMFMMKPKLATKKKHTDIRMITSVNQVWCYYRTSRSKLTQVITLNYTVLDMLKPKLAPCTWLAQVTYSNVSEDAMTKPKMISFQIAR